MNSAKKKAKDRILFNAISPLGRASLGSKPRRQTHRADSLKVKPLAP
jgi:hypothetical protein